MKEGLPIFLLILIYSLQIEAVNVEIIQTCKTYCWHTHNYGDDTLLICGDQDCDTACFCTDSDCLYTYTWKCIRIRSGYYLYNQGTYLEYWDSCPIGYFVHGYFCQGCSSECSSCTDGSTCTSCKYKYFLSGSSCVTDCPATYLGIDEVCVSNPDGSRECPIGTLQISNHCEDCVDYCNSCPLAYNICTECQEGTYFYTDQTVPSTTCESECPNTYYANDTTLTCESCFLDSCYICSNSTNCLECSSSLLSYTDPTGVSECLQECPGGFYSEDSVTCISCGYGCNECSEDSEPSAVYCSSCEENYFWEFLEVGIRCLEKCGSDQYFTQEKECLDCMDHCLECDSEFTCSKCENDYYIMNDTETGMLFVSSSCPQIGYYIDGQECRECAISNCHICSCISECTECDVNYFKLQILYKYDQCLETCPTGYESNNSTYLCTIIEETTTASEDESSSISFLIIAVIAGGAIFCCCAICIIVLILKRKRKKEELKQKGKHISIPSTPPPQTRRTSQPQQVYMESASTVPVNKRSKTKKEEKYLSSTQRTASTKNIEKNKKTRHATTAKLLVWNEDLKNKYFSSQGYSQDKHSGLNNFCSICYLNFERGEKILKSSCKHIIHAKCANTRYSQLSKKEDLICFDCNNELQRIKKSIRKKK